MTRDVASQYAVCHASVTTTAEATGAKQVARVRSIISCTAVLFAKVNQISTSSWVRGAVLHLFAVNIAPEGRSWCRLYYGTMGDKCFYYTVM